MKAKLFNNLTISTDDTWTAWTDLEGERTGTGVSETGSALSRFGVRGCGGGVGGLFAPKSPKRYNVTSSFIRASIRIFPVRLSYFRLQGEESLS